jgi:hypothetical protein
MHDDTATSEEYLKDVLGLSEHMKVESIIAFGYPDEAKH